ncbi:low temperature requirement protein A [Streptomyces beihaiensis]|uniref:Low temperature requirement protein A n=1 Tax=Streptomyces beihaiensis TaxID=2984495 RepID=A0ABT3TUV3_9ACTN|nr:low temperature requirement protein A [Streptomyces beihaiensis]MCX3060794.1 low temperature requirement protein A [Streptomyces beihaiensis]
MVATTDDHAVTTAELFFDLVFVYAITQVTGLMAAHPVPVRVGGAMVVLALLWWCWSCFAWLGNVVRADSGPVFAVLVTVMAVVFIVSLEVPSVYGQGLGHGLGPGHEHVHGSDGLPSAFVFVVCYGLVRLLHLVSYWISAPEDTALRATLRRTALISVAPPFVLLLIGAAYQGTARLSLWAAAVVLDYAGVFITATGASGWRVRSAGHFSERHGLIVIIALGESIVAMGVGVSGYPLTGPVVAACVAGLLYAAALWWLYFKEFGPAAEERVAELDGSARMRVARDVYTYLHLVLVAGIVIGALGVKKVLTDVAATGRHGLAEPLHGVVAWALSGGAGLFLLGAWAITLRATGRGSTTLLVAGVCGLAAGPLTAHVPALAALWALALAVTAVVAATVRASRSPR